MSKTASITRDLDWVIVPALDGEDIRIEPPLAEAYREPAATATWTPQALGVVIHLRDMTPERWEHAVVTRREDGGWRIYLTDCCG